MWQMVILLIVIICLWLGLYFSLHKRCPHPVPTHTVLNNFNAAIMHPGAIMPEYMQTTKL